jgi:tripartite-type tricarboxylate transporter receptor subunit TctC
VVRNDLPVKSIGDLIALAKAQPGKLTFGSGNGSSRGGAELFKIMAKVDLLGVPYKSQPQAVADLLGGRIDVIFCDFTTGLPPVRDGRARGIAVTSAQRYPGLEQYPTVAESGVPGYELTPWNAVYAPAGTPRPIVDKLNRLMREAVASDAYKRLMQTTLGVPFAGSPEDLAQHQEREILKWGEIVRVSGMKEP